DVVTLLSEVVPTMNGAPLDYIPFAFISPEDATPNLEDPPLIDLVDMNLSHFRNTADLEHGAHFTGLPQPWIAGYTKATENEKLYIGGPAAWVFTDPNAKAEYLEFTGTGLGTLVDMMKAK